MYSFPKVYLIRSTSITMEFGNTTNMTTAVPDGALDLGEDAVDIFSSSAVRVLLFALAVILVLLAIHICIKVGICVPTTDRKKTIVKHQTEVKKTGILHLPWRFIFVGKKSCNTEEPV